MRSDLHLQHDLIAVEHGETIHALLELTAPAMPGASERPPATLEVVIDRSGSMRGERLSAALVALDALVGRLRPTDRLGVVAFDHAAQVPVAAGPVGDGTAVRAALGRIHPGGMTNLSGGLLRGIQEARRVAGEEGATVVLLSDGHANQGVTDHARLEAFAGGAHGARISTSTIGIGLGYDEDLLAAIARGGGGNAHFAPDGDEAGRALASEVEGLLAQTAQAVSLTVRPSREVAAVRLFNDLPSTPIEGGFMVELGDLYSEETRRLVLEIDVPAIAELGLAQVCELELRWVDLRTMRSELATIPVHVNVVPGDQAAGRTENAKVVTELAFQRAQRAKRAAADALRDGDVGRADSIWRGAAHALRSARALDPSGELAREAALLEELADQSRRDAMHARKRARADHHMKARRRGREL
jgi:Ca-activated chloride channel family protein